jgi:hypothetical protein
VSAYGWLWIARICLTISRATPIALISFMEDAYEKGLFRQAGPTYSFRHLELQHYFATATH